MGRAGSGNDWVHHWTALTTARDGEDPVDPVAHGARLAACLTDAAVALTTSDAAALDERPRSTAALRLARALAAEAAVPAGETAGGPCGAAPQGDDLARFLAALEDAAHAVYHCRRVVHPRGRCWFSASGPDSGLCGEVLSAAHTMRAPRASLSG